MSDENYSNIILEEAEIKKQKRDKINAQRRVRRANRTQEEKEIQREKDRSYAKKRLEKYKDEINTKRREDRKNWTKEKLERVKERDRKYYQDHKDIIKLRSVNWYKNNKSKANEGAKARYMENREMRIEYQKKYYKDNLEYYTEYNRNRYWNDRDGDLARSHEYYKENKESILEYQAKYYQENKEYLIDYQRKYVNELRNKLYQILGPRCVVCGIDDLQFLTVDHINDDGGRDREERGGLPGLLRYLRGIDWNEKYIRENLQILCYNHNCGKGRRLYLDKPDKELNPGERKNRKLLTETFNFFGPCEVCGESDLRYLSIDHRHNDGAECRRNGEPDGRDLYQYFRNIGWPEDLKQKYGCLCYNHNCGKNRVIYI
jgi:hypothetical protein